MKEVVAVPATFFPIEKKVKQYHWKADALAEETEGKFSTQIEVKKILIQKELIKKKLLVQ